MTRRLTHRGQRRHDELVARALDHFSARGFDGTTVDEIVRVLDVRPTTFSWYFGSAEACFREALTAALDDRRRQLLADADRDAADPLHAIRHRVRARVLWAADHPDRRRLIDQARFDARFSSPVAVADAQLLADAIPPIRAAIGAGILRDLDPASVAYALDGLADGLSGTLAADRSKPADAVADLAVSLALGGVLRPPATGRRGSRRLSIAPPS